MIVCASQKANKTQRSTLRRQCCHKLIGKM